MNKEASVEDNIDTIQDTAAEVGRKASISIFALLGMLLFPAAASAGSSDRVKFSVKPKVAVKLVSKKPGQRTYRIASNAPFRITASGVIGPIRSRITKIGEAAQKPGKLAACRRAAGTLPTTIYRAARKTAAEPARRKAQSVLITLRYSKYSKPVFKIVPRRKKAATPPVGQACETNPQG